ncbi:hypothetical protein HDV57DRAFT_272387 [Trichoderma longibrachiatum]
MRACKIAAESGQRSNHSAAIDEASFISYVFFLSLFFPLPPPALFACSPFALALAVLHLPIFPTWLALTYFPLETFLILSPHDGYEKFSPSHFPASISKLCWWTSLSLSLLSKLSQVAERRTENHLRLLLLYF